MRFPLQQNRQPLARASARECHLKVSRAVDAEKRKAPWTWQARCSDAISRTLQSSFNLPLSNIREQSSATQQGCKAPISFPGGEVPPFPVTPYRPQIRGASPLGAVGGEARKSYIRLPVRHAACTSETMPIATPGSSARKPPVRRTHKTRDPYHLLQEGSLTLPPPRIPNATLFLTRAQSASEEHDAADLGRHPGPPLRCPVFRF